MADDAFGEGLDRFLAEAGLLVVFFLVLGEGVCFPNFGDDASRPSITGLVVILQAWGDADGWLDEVVLAYGDVDGLLSKMVSAPNTGESLLTVDLGD